MPRDPRRLSTSLIGALAGLACTASVASAQAVYVSLFVGDNANPGTQAAPFRTIEAAVAFAAPRAPRLRRG